MALSKGIKVQPSRFAALNLDSDSESDASGNEWFEVVSSSSSKATGTAKTRGAAPTQPKEGQAGDRPLSKSAKKRARKKRSQLSSSEVNMIHVVSVFSTSVCVNVSTDSRKVMLKEKQRKN